MFNILLINNNGDMSTMKYIYTQLNNPINLSRNKIPYHVVYIVYFL